MVVALVFFFDFLYNYYVMANPIKKYPVPLIFKKVLKARMSGELIVTCNNLKKKIFFEEGSLIFAATSVENERLGKILLAAKKITGDQLEKVLQIQKNNPNTKIGELLVNNTDLTMPEIYSTIKIQMKIIAASTFSLKQGEWRFIEKKPEPPEGQRFRIKLPEIIHDGVKKIEDTYYFRRKFYSRSPVTTFLPPLLFRYLTSDEADFYAELGNFSSVKMSVEQIIPKMKLPEKFFWRYLILLYLVNVVDFVEFTVDELRNQNIEDINELYSKINSKEIDYYKLLKIKENATFAEIKKAYLDYSQKYQPESLKAAPDSTVIVKVDAVLGELKKAYEVLSDFNKKSKYDAGLLKQDAPKKPDPGSRVKNAKDFYLQGNALYKQKKYFEAVSMLEKAVKLDPRANFFLLLGLSQAKLPAMKPMAEKSLQKAADMEPWNADPIFALGELYRSENLIKKAEAYFEKALEINMEHTLAGKAIKDFEKFSSGKKQLFSIFGKKK